jgi:hypothetical protein
LPLLFSASVDVSSRIFFTPGPKSLIFESVPELSFHSRKPTPGNRFLEAQILLIRPGTKIHGTRGLDQGRPVLEAEVRSDGCSQGCGNGKKPTP